MEQWSLPNHREVEHSLERKGGQFWTVDKISCSYERLGFHFMQTGSWGSLVTTSPLTSPVIYSDQPNPSTLSGKWKLFCHAQKWGVCGCRNQQETLEDTDSRCLWSPRPWWLEDLSSSDKPIHLSEVFPLYRGGMGNNWSLQDHCKIK